MRLCPPLANAMARGTLQQRVSDSRQIWTWTHIATAFDDDDGDDDDEYNHTICLSRYHPGAANNQAYLRPRRPWLHVTPLDESRRPLTHRPHRSVRDLARAKTTRTMASLQIPMRGKSGGTPTTKAVILVGGPSRGTRFRPLSLDLPKV